MTIHEATEIMRNMVAESPDSQCQFMAVAADVWEEAEDVVKCTRCHGDGLVSQPCIGPCHSCSRTGYVSNGNSLRAEALRLLAECGKVGQLSDDQLSGGYYGNEFTTGEEYRKGNIASGWYSSMRKLTNSYYSIDERLFLLDAYAAADRATREAWARKTRKLAGWVECEGCWGEGPCEMCNGTHSVEHHSGNGVINCPNGYDDDDGHWLGNCRTVCPACHGTGLVPPAPVEVLS